MSVPKHTTPPPTDHHLREARRAQQRIPDETPDWINDVRHQTPGFAKQAQMGGRARPTYGLQQHKPLDARTHVLTMEPCWDCDGKGYTGLLLYPCPRCHVHYTAEQMQVHGTRNDEWRTISFPCGHNTPAADVYSVREKCPVCSDKQARNAEGDSIYTGKPGFVWHKRSLLEFVAPLAEAIKDLIGLGGRTQPEVHALFQQSAPTAPAPHLEHPAVHIPERFTPTLNPLPPEEF